MIGRTLGHYEIVEKLGEGGMGAVYRARDTTLGRDVALKLLPEFVAADREKIARLEREARLLASLSHPNIATLHGLEESNGLKYLVMELVPGETLAERISRGPLRIEECLGIFRQIAEGLEAAHEKGIVHRDLKPANVIVTSEGRVKVLDFGLAKAVAEEAPSSDLSKSPTLTREGTEQGVILGTASYMSPEQARGKTLDRRTDIWSFGCVFYEALTGTKAFSGETVSDILAAILEREPDWTALPARTPVKIRELLRWCLQKDPHRRLRDIGDARIEIDEPSATPVTVPRHRYVPWIVAALVSGIAVWSFLRPEVEPERAVSRFTVNVPPEQALTWANDPSVALSPDGKRLVYVGSSGNEQRLYVRSLDQLEARPIPGTEGAMTAFFSPDGEWVGFYEAGKLEKVRLDGGLPIILCDAPNPGGASWGPRDTILFSPGGVEGLSRVSASGGSSSVVSTPDPSQGEFAHLWPDILPNGKTALFTILTGTGIPRIGLLSLETGEYRVLLEGGSFARYVPTGHLAYVSEGVLLAAPFDLERLEVTGKPVPILEGVWTHPTNGTAHFALSLDGTLAYVPGVAAERTLVWVDRVGAVRPITEDRRPYLSPRLSPDGQRLAVTIEDHIWVYDMVRDALSRVTFGPNQEYFPIWTPDGSHLTYGSGDPFNIFWQPVDGSGEAERLTTSENTQLPTSWSPDGKILVYSELMPTGQYDIGLVTLEGQRKTHTFLQTPFNEAGGVFSLDGRFLAYTSNESGRFEIYVRPFPGPGSKWQISSDGGVQPVWARSGREMFYRNGDKMMAVTIETEPGFRAGKPTLLFEGPFLYPDLRAAQYDIASDGQNFVMIQELESGPTQIHIVLNWFEELKARVPSAKR
jgi:serine/threonine-protein kinase